MKKVESVRWLDEPPLNIGPATIQLDGYYIKELHCQVSDRLTKRAKFTVGTGLHIQQPDIMTCPPISTDITVHFGQNKKDPLRFRVALQVTSHEADKDDPYTFDIQLVGYFSLKDGVKPFPGMDIFVQRNAVMILYSTAREVISSVTSRGPFPALMLPTLSFNITDKARDAIRAEVVASQKSVAAKKQPRQLPPANKTSKKKASKKGAKK